MFRAVLYRGYWLVLFSFTRSNSARLLRSLLPTCLRRKQDVRVTLLPVDTTGYKLEFEFAENEFFTNTILSKVYYYEVSLAPAMACVKQFVDSSFSTPG